MLLFFILTSLSFFSIEEEYFAFRPFQQERTPEPSRSSQRLKVRPSFSISGGSLKYPQDYLSSLSSRSLGDGTFLHVFLPLMRKWPYSLFLYDFSIDMVVYSISLSWGIVSGNGKESVPVYFTLSPHLDVSLPQLLLFCLCDDPFPADSFVFDFLPVPW